MKTLCLIGDRLIDARQAGTRPHGCKSPPAAMVLALLLLVAGSASAQNLSDQPISTDRPGIPFGTSIVPVGHLQLETGLPTFENDALAGGHSLLLSAPTYLRYGVSDSFEVQLAASPWNHLTTTQGGDSHSVSGFGDMQVGVKFALAAGDGHAPAVALVGYVTVPSGDRDFSAGRSGYNLNAVAAWPLDQQTGLTTMISYTHSAMAGGRDASSGTLAASVSRAFTSRITAYVEAGWFPGLRNAASTGQAGGGVTYLLTSKVQIDGFFDLGLNRASPNSVFGTGMSVLF